MVRSQLIDSKVGVEWQASQKNDTQNFTGENLKPLFFSLLLLISSFYDNLENIYFFKLFGCESSKIYSLFFRCFFNLFE